MRSRWVGAAALSLLIGIVSAAAMSASAAARRTENAFPDALATGAHFDFTVQSNLSLAATEHLSGVQNDVRETWLGSGLSHIGAKTYFEAGVFSVLGATKLLNCPAASCYGPYHIKLLAGRLPNPHSLNEVLADYSTVQLTGVHVGSIIEDRFYGDSLKQVEALNNGGAPTGPTFRFRVVGIYITALGIMSGRPYGNVQVTPAFVRAEAHRILTVPIDLIRLRSARDGAEFETALGRAAGGIGNTATIDWDIQQAAVERSIGPQVAAWWVLAAVAGAAGLVVVGLAMARQVAREEGAYATLNSLGVGPRQLMGIGVARAALVGAAGGLIGMLIAYLVSPLTPIGLAGLIELSPGLHFDAAVLLLGALATTVAAVVLAAWPIYRHVRLAARAVDETAPSLRTSAAVTFLSRLGASPAVVVGARQALERGRGRNSFPVGTALAGSVVGVLALVATAVFGASLSHLILTPRLYGADFSLAPTGGYEGAGPSVVRATRALLLTLPGVTQVSWGTVADVSAGGHETDTLALEPVRGPLSLSVVAGRAPTRINEVDLGKTTMAALRAKVGSTVKLTFNRSTRSYLVVGEAAFPVAFGPSGSGLGTGIAMTFSALQALSCPSPHTPGCPLLRTTVYVSFANTAAGRASYSKVLAGQSEPGNPYNLFALGPPWSPSSLVNFGQTDLPLLIEILVLIFGLATLLHLLFLNLYRRRRELGVLKAIGFVRRQVVGAFGWQSATIAVVGVVAGVPLGIALGRLAWDLTAGYFGVVPSVNVPVAQVSIFMAAVIVVAGAVALVPGAIAAYSSPAPLLRSE